MAAAEQMYERALCGYEKALGEENTTIYIPALNTMWGLGALHESQDDIPKARIMYLKAFAGMRKLLDMITQGLRVCETNLVLWMLLYETSP
jgi:hypothetical protein